MIDEKLKEAGHRAVRDMIKQYSGIILSVEDVAEFMKSCEEENWEWWKSEYEADSVTDTMVRDMVFDEFANYYLGVHWPLNGEGAEYSNIFFDNLRKLIKNKNWECER